MARNTAFGAGATLAVLILGIGGYILWAERETRAPERDRSARTMTGDGTGPATGQDAVTDGGGTPAVAPHRDDGDPEARVATGPDTLEAPAQDPPETPSPPPRLDLVRIDGAGGAIVAGTAGAGEDVILRVDGAEVARTVADESGAFVSLLDVPLMEAPRMLSLEVTDADGTTRRAEESVIVAPRSPTSQISPDRSAIEAAGLKPDGAQGNDPGTSTGVAAHGSSESGRRDRSGPAPAGSSAPRAEVPPPAPTSEAIGQADRTRQRARSDAAEPRPGVTEPALDPLAAMPDPDRVIGQSSATGPQQVAESGAVAVASGEQAGPPATAPAPSPLSEPASGARNAAGDVFEDAAASSPPSSAPAAPRLFRVGPDGVSALAGPADPPDVLETLGIDAISYDQLGEVRLSGRGQGARELRIYLDNRPVQTARVDDSGAWASPLPGVAEGTYTLRIDALGADGRVEGRVETPFRRTAPEVAAEVEASGVAAVTVQPGYTLWAISEGFFGEGVRYVQIFEANRDLIRDPDLIYPGQVFTLPEANRPAAAGEAVTGNP